MKLWSSYTVRVTTVAGPCVCHGTECSNDAVTMGTVHAQTEDEFRTHSSVQIHFVQVKSTSTMVVEKDWEAGFWLLLACHPINRAVRVNVW